MLEFAWLWVLLLLPLPLLVRLLPARKQQQQPALKVTELHHFPRHAGPAGASGKTTLILAGLIWCLLVIATARPRWLGEPIAQPTQARELILAVDLSGSMQEDDMRLDGRWVDRLTMVKDVLAKFIERREGDRLGLILFADHAYVQAPLTFDRETVATLLDETVLKLVGDRTAIGEALGLAVKRFDSRENSNRVVILLTDGQNTAGDLSPAQATELAVAKDVTVYSIGVGAERTRRGFFAGLGGSDLDEQGLTRIAEQTGGRYFRAVDGQSLEQIYQILDELEPVESDTKTLRPQTALFPYPLALALLLSMAAILPRPRWLRRDVQSTKPGAVHD